MNSRTLLPRSFAWVLAAVAAGAIGCAAQPDVASSGPHTPRPATPGSIGAPFVQAGTAFSVRMDRPADTYFTANNTPFSATVVNPLEDEGGRVVVPYGSKVHGTVDKVGDAEHPRLRLNIVSIDTVAGTLPVQAAVRHAQHVEWAGPARVIGESNSFDADAYLMPGDVAGNDWPGFWSQATGAPYYGEVIRQPKEVRVPQDALVEFVLVRPLILPATTQIPGATMMQPPDRQLHQGTSGK